MLRFLALILPLLLAAPALSAQPRTGANVLLIFAGQDVKSTRAAVNTIVAEGGRVDHVFPPNAVIGYVPLNKVSRMTALIQTARIEYGPVDVSVIGQYGEGPRLAATVWNTNFQL